jgi:uncharacterized protein
MTFQLGEILESIAFVSLDHFDIRTVTLGVSLRNCHRATGQQTAAAVYERLMQTAGNLVTEVNRLSNRYNVPVANRRISITPVSILCEGSNPETPVLIARAIDRSAKELGVDFIGGFTALIDRGITPGEADLIEALPQVLSETDRVCSSFNVATTRSGLNLDAIILLASKLKKISERTADRDGIGCAKLVIFANAVEDNPFMAGAFHGLSLGDVTVSVGISGPGVVRQMLEDAPRDLPLQDVAERIKKASFKMTRVGELFLQECSKALGFAPGIIDVSLAPTPDPGDSVADILELIGVERVGAPGTTAALALLNDAIKKGGAMAASRVGGMSGAFIPVSEDAGMIRAASEGALSLDKLEALTCVCSVGLDMIAVPGDTTSATLAGIIADECAIGMMNNKTTGVRIIPVPGKKPGDLAVFGGLLGEAPVMEVSRFSSEGLVGRGGFIPTPLQGFRN